VSATIAKPRAKKSGLVNCFVSAPRKNGTDASINAGDVIKASEAGLPVKELADLQASLDIPAERLAPMPGISKATVHRQKRAGGKLNLAVSDRVVRFARLLGQAVRVFGDIEDAKRWLNSPQFGLGGAVPLEYAIMKPAPVKSKICWAVSNTEFIRDAHGLAHCARGSG
jgi:putative toxin-antitoxin system antitoxin component (TIGR02293 family)